MAWILLSDLSDRDFRLLSRTVIQAFDSSKIISFLLSLTHGDVRIG